MKPIIPILLLANNIFLFPLVIPFFENHQALFMATSIMALLCQAGVAYILLEHMKKHLGRNYRKWTFVLFACTNLLTALTLFKNYHPLLIEYASYIRIFTLPAYLLYIVFIIKLVRIKTLETHQKKLRLLGWSMIWTAVAKILYILGTRYGFIPELDFLYNPRMIIHLITYAISHVLLYDFLITPFDKGLSYKDTVFEDVDPENL